MSRSLSELIECDKHSREHCCPREKCLGNDGGRQTVPRTAHQTNITISRPFGSIPRAPSHLNFPFFYTFLRYWNPVANNMLGFGAISFFSSCWPQRQKEEEKKNIKQGILAECDKFEKANF